MPKTIVITQVDGSKLELEPHQSLMVINGNGEAHAVCLADQHLDATVGRVVTLGLCYMLKGNHVDAILLRDTAKEYAREYTGTPEHQRRLAQRMHDVMKSAMGKEGYEH